jgi:hypothetical protein
MNGLARSKRMKYGFTEKDTYTSKRSSSSAKPPVDLFAGEDLASSTAASIKAS